MDFFKNLGDQKLRGRHVIVKSLNDRHLHGNTLARVTFLWQIYAIFHFLILALRTLKLREVICAKSQTLGLESVKLHNRTLFPVPQLANSKMKLVRRLQNAKRLWLAPK